MATSPKEGDIDGSINQQNMLSSLFNELRLALRGLRHAPVYTLSAVTTLALGIGANALAATFANSLFLRPMPFVHDAELVGISATHRAANGEIIAFAPSTVDMFAYIVRNKTLTGIGAIDSRTYTLLGPERPETVLGAAMTASMWKVLGTQPIAGRTFTQNEDVPGSSVTVISETLQRRLFPGFASSALGQSIVVDGLRRTIIGVMPLAFRPRMNPGDVWIPFGATPSTATTARQCQLVGRLKPGVSMATASEDITRIARELSVELPATHRDWGASVTRLREKIGDSARAVTLTLVAAVAFLLLMTCANATNLAMARVSRRKADFATRIALGASRASLARNQLAESLLIGLAAGTVGVILATVCLPPAMRLLATDNPLVAAATMDWRVVAMVFAESVVVAVVCAIAPIAYGLSIASASALGAARRQQAGRAEQRTRRILMTTQVGVASLLLVGSFGAVAALRKLSESDIGFVAGQLHVGKTSLPLAIYPKLPERARFATSVLQRLRSTPGIVSASLSTAPFVRGQQTQGMIVVEGTGQVDPLAAEVRRIDADYFKTIGLPLLRGRAFSADDRDSMPPVVIVSQSFARQYIGKRDPIGARVKRGANPPATVVGVVPDVMDSGVGVTIGPMMYLPYMQASSAAFGFIVRTALAPLSIESAIRDAIKGVDGSQPLDAVTPVNRLLDDSLGENRFKTWLLAVLSGLAVAVACVGIYGVTSYLMAERTAELAIRIALGARPMEVVRHFVLDASRWVIAGTILGSGVAFAISRAMLKRVPEFAAAGVFDYVIGGLLLVVVGIVAAAVPTIRASGVAPAEVLRGQ